MIKYTSNNHFKKPEVKQIITDLYQYNQQHIFTSKFCMVDSDV